MPLESVTHLSDLNLSNPPGSDGLSQADDHIRNIKKALLTDFPGITGVVNATQAQLNLLNSIAALTVLANATNGAAAPTAIAAASDGQVFRRSGTALAFGAIDASNPNAMTKNRIILPNSAGLAKTDTTYTDIPGLTGISLEAGIIYAFEMFLIVTQTSAGGVKVKANPSLALQSDYVLADVTTTIPSHNHFASNMATGIAQAGSGAEEIRMQICGAIRANVSASTLAMQMAQNAALGTTTLVVAWLRLTKLG